MASPADLAQLPQGLPDTLPEDFAEWDGGAAAASQADRDAVASNVFAAPASQAPAAAQNGAAVPNVAPIAGAPPAGPVPAVTRIEPTAMTARFEPSAPSPDTIPSAAARQSERTAPTPAAQAAPSAAPKPAPASTQSKPRESGAEEALFTPTAFPDIEVFRASLLNAAATLKSQPSPERAAPATPGQPNSAAPSNEAHVPLVRPASPVPDRPAGPVVDQSRNTNSSPVLPPSTAADEEAFFHELRAIGNVLNSQPIRPSHRPILSRATDDLAARLALSNGSASQSRSDASDGSSPSPAPSKSPTKANGFTSLNIAAPANDASAQSRSAAPDNSDQATSAAPAKRSGASGGITSLNISVPSNGSAPANRSQAPLRQAPAPGPSSSDRPARSVPPSRPAPSAAPAQQPAATERRWQAKPIRVTANAAAAANAAPEPAASNMFRSDLANTGEQHHSRAKWVKIGIAGVAALLVVIFLGIRIFSPGKRTLAKQSASQTVIMDQDPAATASKPSPATPMPESRILTTAGTAPPQGDQPSTQTPSDDSSRVDSQLMNDQLNAKPLIPNDVKAKVKEDAPPPDSLSPVNTAELASSAPIGTAFNRQAHPDIKYVPYPVVSIPASVAESLLIQKTKPVFPRGAWYDYKIGKVVLLATVSRNGLVEDVRFISGPREFRQAAVDAVKTWRFKPYVIDNVAREFQTTISVNFDANSASSNPLSYLHFGSHAKKTASTDTKTLPAGSGPGSTAGSPPGSGTGSGAGTVTAAGAS